MACKETPTTSRIGKGHRGFTLVEMLGVLAVLAVLLGITIPVLQSTRNKARAARAKSGILAIESALQLYKEDFGVAPSIAATRLILAAEGLYTIKAKDPAGPAVSPSTQQPYVQVPAAQMNAVTGQFLDPWKKPYWINPTPAHNPGGFDVFSSGPDQTRGNADDVNNWSR